MAWGLGGAYQPDEQEGRWGQWDRGGSREWTISEASEVFKEQIMEEHWVFSVSTYLWPWGVETVVEGSGYKWEEEEEVFDYIEGWFVAYLTLGGNCLGIIGQKASSQR